MNNDGENGFPSQETIALEMGMSVRQVRRLIEKAEDAGWVTREKKVKVGAKWHYTKYYISIPENNDRTSTTVSTGHPRLSTGHLSITTGHLRLSTGHPCPTNSTSITLQTKTLQQNSTNVTLQTGVASDPADPPLNFGEKNEKHTLTPAQGSLTDTSLIKVEPTEEDKSWFTDVPSKSSGDTACQMVTSESLTTFTSSNGAQTSPVVTRADNEPKVTQHTSPSSNVPNDSTVTLKKFGRWRTNQPPLTKKYFDSISDPLDKWNFIQSRQGQELFCDFKPQDRRSLELVAQLEAKENRKCQIPSPSSSEDNRPTQTKLHLSSEVEVEVEERPKKPRYGRFNDADYYS